MNYQSQSKCPWPKCGDFAGIFEATGAVKFDVAPVLHLVDEKQEACHRVRSVSEAFGFGKVILQRLVSVWAMDVGKAQELFPGLLDVGFGGELLLLVFDRAHRLLHLPHRFRYQACFDLVQRGHLFIVGFVPGFTQPRIFSFSDFGFC